MRESQLGLIDPALDGGLVLGQLVGFEPQGNLLLGSVDAICNSEQTSAKARNDGFAYQCSQWQLVCHSVHLNVG